MTRALCLVAGAVILLPGAADAQTFKYLAFGDSITCGKYDQPLVCSGPGTINPLSDTGYPGRLRDQLGCNNGANCEVYNYGDPGESTGEDLSRINGVLDNGNGPYDVMLLMHGTNDVFGNDSNTTIEHNLKEMDDRAASRGVDTVFASIIEFHYQGTKPGKNTQIANLKNDLKNAVAPGRDSWFANPWAVLCGNFSNSCFDNHYANIPNPDTHGLHPDGSGFDRMANEFEAAVKQHPAPGAPALQSPADNADVASTSVSWNSTANTTWYEVDWDPGGSQWVQAKEDASCEGGGTCSWTIPNLGPGDHTWRVRSRNPRGRSGWTGFRAFHLFTSPPNPADTVSPESDIYDGVEPAEFVWTDETVATNGPTKYQVNIERDGATVFNQDVTNPTCNGGECSHDPGITWTPGDYRWRVRSENPAGQSAWSAWQEFLFTDVAPDTPTPLYPVDDTDTFDTTPLFIWTQEFGAEGYMLQIDAESPQSVGTCNGTTCSWAPANPRSVGMHSWKVLAENSIDASAFSASEDFEILDCASFPDLVLDSGNSGSATQHACDTITAEGSYRVTGDLILHAGSKVILGDNFTIAPGSTLHLRVDP